jgi:plastocyanin
VVATVVAVMRGQAYTHSNLRGTMQIRRTLAIGVVALLPVTLAACGGESGTAPPTNGNGNGNGQPPAPTTAQVSMLSADDGYGYESHSFSPNEVTIKRAGTVTWANPSGVPHNVTFASSNAPANIADRTDGSESRTFSSTGQFDYQCTNHAGMTGRVVVVD